jgi:hypothetical protein
MPLAKTKEKLPAEERPSQSPNSEQRSHLSNGQQTAQALIPYNNF